MGKYQKKPVVIDAEQWFEGNPDVEGMHTTGGGANQISWCQARNGRPTVFDGDWIIKSSDGTFSLCRPDIFEDEYEEVLTPLISDCAQARLVERKEHGKEAM